MNKRRIVTLGEGLLQWFSVAALVCTLAAPMRAVADGERFFVTNPYVVGATAESADIQWISPPGVGEAVIVLRGPDGVERRLAEIVDTPQFDDAELEDGSKRSELRHVAHAADLKPGTRYRYSVTYGKAEGEHAEGEFTTFLSEGDARPFSFVVASDTHINHPNAASSIAALNPAFVVVAGDFIDGDGWRWRNFRRYLRSSRPYTSLAPLVPVIGGHDINPDHNFRALFGLDRPERALPEAQASYYTGVCGCLRYIVLDSYVDEAGMAAETQWLEDVLRENKARWTLVVFHEPIFAVGSRGIMDGQPRWAALFEQYGVDLVISGHNHIYERLLPLGEKGKKPVNYLTINTNGGKFRVIRPSPIVAGGIGRQVRCFAQISVDGDSLLVQVRDVDGVEFDRLALHKDKDGLYQEAVMAAALPVADARTIAHVFSKEGKSAGMYERQDMVVRIPPKPTPKKPVAVELDTSAFPKGSTLHVRDNREVSDWHAKEGVYPVTGSWIAIELMAPTLPSVKEGRVKPPLVLRLALEYKGRVFEATDVNPTVVVEE